MNGFLWTAGHLGWGIFALAVFTGLWLVLSDFCWRLTRIRITRFAATMAMGWIVGVALILLGFYLASR
ncbi:MAG TPA: hypothetical protein VJ833_12175 [Rhodanobacteraceae bacterium]|nr:hypothetical protein [Rhodanobacteraceae bacterium]